MRYHHWGGDCHGYGYQGGWHGGCASGYGYAHGPAWACGPDLPFDEPRYGVARGRGLGYAASRPTAQRLEGYLESLREEMRAIEQDLSDLRGESGEQGRPTV